MFVRNYIVAFRFLLLLILCFSPSYGVVAPNPFLRPGSEFKPSPTKSLPVKQTNIRPGIAKELDFKGYFILKGQPFFSLFNKKVNHSEWITLSEKTYEEFMAQSFDLETETLTILYEGQSFDLKLIDAKSGVGIPNSIGKPSPVANSVPGAGKSTSPKIMPPQPNYVPSFPPSITPFAQNQQPGRSTSSFTSSKGGFSSGMPGLSIPGLRNPGPIPPRSVPSYPSNAISPEKSGRGNTGNRNSGSTFPSTSQPSVPNNNLSNDPVDPVNSGISNPVDFQNLPPPPPPPNILPPSPPPDIEPARE